ncbi:hypothetical protein BZL29_4688 [Mycobacterium kansasii]|uniref:Uncharacterized protein n=1 Tax=Mycobacterium kansasii TaxID=1768 RepID=A0A1V3X7B1_MYCKA|nr:hypothetical protein BZL29_4688 [Mycobacterium kansasii]
MTPVAARPRVGARPTGQRSSARVRRFLISAVDVSSERMRWLESSAVALISPA